VAVNLKQEQLQEWQTYNFGKQPVERVALGMAEEVGELCRLILKRAQGIRMAAGGAELRADIADAFADCVIYGIQVMTNEGLNAEDVLEMTIGRILMRDWRKYPKNGETE